MHRDIKPENILVCVDKKGRIYDVKLADFGLACKITDKTRQRTTAVGSTGYMAPEILNLYVYGSDYSYNE